MEIHDTRRHLPSPKRTLHFVTESLNHGLGLHTLPYPLTLSSVLPRQSHLNIGSEAGISFKSSSVVLSDSEDRKDFGMTAGSGVSDEHLSNFVLIASMVQSSISGFLPAVFVPFRTRFLFRNSRQFSSCPVDFWLANFKV